MSSCFRYVWFLKLSKGGNIFFHSLFKSIFTVGANNYAPKDVLQGKTCHKSEDLFTEIIRPKPN